MDKRGGPGMLALKCVVCRFLAPMPHWPALQARDNAIRVSRHMESIVTHEPRYELETDVANGSPQSSPAADPPALDLAKLAHELRTPLGAIAVLSEIMRDERLGPLGSQRYQGYAADIHESATHANSVLSSFLDPGAAAHGAGGAMDFVELDLGELVSGTVSALEPLAARSGVALRASLAPGLPHLIADRRSLRQMLNNLIANALKFTPPGREIVVAVSYAVGGAVELMVADTGDGMTEPELVHMQADVAVPEPLRRRSGGTGYGLPLVRALATASGATLEIDSALRAGTRVRITFPHARLVLV